MRIILVGQGPFGHKVLDSLLAGGENMAGVFCPGDKRGEAMKALAESSGIALFQPNRMKDSEVCDAFTALRPDLVILAFVTDLISETLLDIPSIGTICYHPSLLPKHRGASGINWAIIQGDSHTGLTIFWVDQGIDTGPILLQKEVEIAPDDTSGSLYFNHLFPMGIDAIIEAVDRIKKGTAPKIPQDDTAATYEPPCDDKVASIDWSKPALEVYNLVRGCEPQPGAYSTFQRMKVRFYQTRLLPLLKEQKMPGEIVDISGEKIVAVLHGGTLRIGKIRVAEGTKMSAAEFAEKAGLKVGMKFGS